MLQCEVVQSENEVFTYVHEKTTELKDVDNDLIYTTDITSKPNFESSIESEPVPQAKSKRRPSLILYFFLLYSNAKRRP